MMIMLMWRRELIKEESVMLYGTTPIRGCQQVPHPNFGFKLKIETEPDFLEKAPAQLPSFFSYSSASPRSITPTSTGLLHAWESASILSKLLHQFVTHPALAVVNTVLDGRILKSVNKGLKTLFQVSNSSDKTVKTDPTLLPKPTGMLPEAPSKKSVNSVG